MEKLPDYPFDEQSLESLLKLYEKTFDEINKLRDFEWKIAVSSVVLTGAILAIVSNDKITPLLAAKVFDSVEARWIVAAAQLLATTFGIWCLLVAHHYLTIQRQIRRDLEMALGFHEIGRYLPFNSLLPPAFAKRKRFSFQFTGLVFPLISLMLTIQALAIFVVWKLK
jgi:carbon starvation protein CstA